LELIGNEDIFVTANKSPKKINHTILNGQKLSFSHPHTSTNQNREYQYNREKIETRYRNQNYYQKKTKEKSKYENERNDNQNSNGNKHLIYYNNNDKNNIQTHFQNRKAYVVKGTKHHQIKLLSFYHKRTTKNKNIIYVGRFESNITVDMVKSYTNEVQLNALKIKLETNQKGFSSFRVIIENITQQKDIAFDNKSWPTDVIVSKYFYKNNNKINKSYQQDYNNENKYINDENYRFNSNKNNACN
jgi:hypothetical protein